jgi:hypothetical protein
MTTSPFIRKALPYLAIALALLLAVPIGMKILNVGRVWLWLAIVCHFLSALSFTAGFYLLTGETEERRRRDNVWYLYVSIICITMPFYGIFIAFIIYEIQRRKKTLPPPIVSDVIEIQDPSVFERMLSRSDQLEVLDRLDIEPFIDIFRRGQSALKKSAVKLLGTIQSKKAITTLNMALMDEDIEIRLFAAGVLGRIEDEYAIEIKNRSFKYDSMPGDREAGMEFADMCVSYAESGLLDRVAMSYYYEQAIRVLEQLPANEEVLYLKARCNLELRNYEEAGRDAKRCLDMKRDDPRFSQLLWDILFSEKDYSALVAGISEAHRRNVQGIDKGIAEFWS